MTDLETEITFKALSSLGYGGSFGETLDSFKLNNGNALTSVQRKEIDAEIIRLQAEYDNAQYARDRAEAYPSLADQADMQFHDAVDGTTTWQDAIQAVKDANPKP